MSIVAIYCITCVILAFLISPISEVIGITKYLTYCKNEYFFPIAGLYVFSWLAFVLIVVPMVIKLLLN